MEFNSLAEIVIKPLIGWCVGWLSVILPIVFFKLLPWK